MIKRYIKFVGNTIPMIDVENNYLAGCLTLNSIPLSEIHNYTLGYEYVNISSFSIGMACLFPIKKP